MGPTLRAMLLDWRVRCPRCGGELQRVFPGPGRLQPWPRPRLRGGGPKLAGHASAVVTLGHYTQAVRGGEVAVAALERAYRI